MATKRERMLAALKREKGGYVPWDINPCPELLEQWKKHIGTELHPCDYYDSDFRSVGIGPTKMKLDWHALNPDVPVEATFGEGGVPVMPATSPEGHHFVHRLPSALKDANSVGQVESYPWPDVDADYRWAGVPEKIHDLHEKGYAVMGGAGGFFEGMMWLRGMELTMMDLTSENPIIIAIVNKCAEATHTIAVRMARLGADILQFGDDFGNQDRMMISPEMWRYWFKELFAGTIRQAKAVNPDILIFLHSCGYIEPIIPDLVEIGVDILNPVQPECMNPEKLKAEFGDRLSFWGTVGVQRTMPYGTAAAVRELVKRRIEVIGKGGGLFLSPAHMLEPEVPLENVLAFADAVREFGGHRG